MRGKFIKWTRQQVLTNTLIRLSQLTTSLWLLLERWVPEVPAGLFRAHFPFIQNEGQRRRLWLLLSPLIRYCIDRKSKDNNVSTGFYFYYSAEYTLKLLVQFQSQRVCQHVTRFVTCWQRWDFKWLTKYGRSSWLWMLARLLFIKTAGNVLSIVLLVAKCHLKNSVLDK